MVRIRALSVVAVIALFSVAAVLINALQAPPSTAKRSAGGFHFKPSPKVRAILDKVDSRRIVQYDQALVGFRNRNTLSAQNDPEQGIGAARDYIFNKFQDFAERSDGRMSVRLQSYIQPKVPELLPRDVRITNVVATLRGTQPASIGRTYVVSGHYDSRCSDVFDTKCLAPGADDDASGVSAVLEMARVMAGHEFDATIIFMAVAGEEQGLFGSTRFVDVAKRNDLDVGGMITNDIVGASNGADPHTVRVFSEGVPSDETADEPPFESRLAARTIRPPASSPASSRK